MSSYKEKLRHPKWQKKRLVILDRDNFTCKTCGDTETTLHVHHLKYSGPNPWDAPDDDLITLCEDCHWGIEQLGFMPLKIVKRKSIADLEHILLSMFFAFPEEQGGYNMVTFLSKQLPHINFTTSLNALGYILGNMPEVFSVGDNLNNAWRDAKKVETA